MSRITRILVGLLCALVLSSCQSSPKSERNAGSGSSEESSSADLAPKTPANPPAVLNKIKNCRVLSYDPRTGATIILVNRGHAWRATEKGQLAITNGQRSTTYNVLSDKQMDSLIETMKKRKMAFLREEFSERHVALLKKRSRSGDSFKGLIIIENDGRRYSYIAKRPRGKQDLMGHQKYAIFRDLREAVFYWQHTGDSEQVGMADLGLSPAEHLDVPRDEKR